MQSRPLPPGLEFQSQYVMSPGMQCGEVCTPSVSTHLPRAAGNSVEFLQCTPPTHTGSVDHINLTLPVGADAYMPARQDAQPVCAGYAAAGIAERSTGNLQTSVSSTWPRPNEGGRYTQTQPAPSSTQPLNLVGTQTAVMQPENFRPSLQPSSVNVPMSLHRFDGAQMQRQYGLSEGTQRVQTTLNNYSIQPMLVHDEGSLALGRTQTYSAVSIVQCLPLPVTAGESGTSNLQSSVAAYGLAPSPNPNFSDRNGVPGPRGPSVGPPLGPPFLSYPSVTGEYSMPHSNTQNEFIQNLHTVQNSNTRNSRELNLFSENNFRSENNFHSQSVKENNDFVFPCTVSYQPIYSTASMTGLGLLPGHSDPRGLPLPFPVGPGSSVTWSTTTTTHPVHRESTSSCVVGQGQSRSVNSATDFDVRHGLPPSMFNHYGQSSTTPAGLPLPVSTYPTSGPATTVLHLPATSNCMYNRDVYGHL